MSNRAIPGKEDIQQEFLERLRRMIPRQPFWALVDELLHGRRADSYVFS